MKLPNRTINAVMETHYETETNLSFDQLVKFVCDFSSKIEDKYGVVPDNNEIQVYPGYSDVLLSWDREIENPNYNEEMEAYQIYHKAEKIRELKRANKLASLELKREFSVENRKQRILRNIEKIITESKPDEKFEALDKYLSFISKNNVYNDVVKGKIM